MVLVVVVVLAVAVAAVAALVVRRAAGTARARIDAAVGELDVRRRAKANFYGVASAGPSQVRGLGTLVLTPDELAFFQLVPAAEVRVPRSAITHVEVARSFLGKTQGRDLLVVEWRTAADEDGAAGEDRVAFDVPQLDEWRVALTDGS
jgi:hypothetical protein